MTLGCTKMFLESDRKQQSGVISLLCCKYLPCRLDQNCSTETCVILSEQSESKDLRTDCFFNAIATA